jgi:hypothetical protein
MSYTVEYNDGDVHKDKPSSELRLSKIRHPPVTKRLREVDVMVHSTDSKYVGENGSNKSSHQSVLSISSSVPQMASSDSPALTGAVKFTRASSTVTNATLNSYHNIDEELLALVSVVYILMLFYCYFINVIERVRLQPGQKNLTDLLVATIVGSISSRFLPVIIFDRIDIVYRSVFHCSQ